MIAKGGQPIYGIDVGILMLDAQFPRIMGDMGNARTWPFPVRYKIVRGASPEVVVLQGAEGTLDAFIEAGRELVAEGCRVITTNCGVLGQIPGRTIRSAGRARRNVGVNAGQPRSKPCCRLGRRVGILTISAATLTEAHLQAAGVPEGTPVAGVADGCEFQRAILGNALTLDVDQAEADLAAAARAFQAAHPDLGAILLECTNMPPYKRGDR